LSSRWGQLLFRQLQVVRHPMKHVTNDDRQLWLRLQLWLVVYTLVPVHVWTVDHWTVMVTRAAVVTVIANACDHVVIVVHRRQVDVMHYHWSLWSMMLSC
jgi:hypothetical protein